MGNKVELNMLVRMITFRRNKYANSFWKLLRIRGFGNQDNNLFKIVVQVLPDVGATAGDVI